MLNNFNIFGGDFIFSKSRLYNVAPYCTVTTSGWTGSTTGEVLTTVTTATASPITGKISLPPVNPLSSFTVHYTIGTVTYSVTADASGNLNDGNLTGTIAQDGTYSLSFTTLPTAGTNITADYSYGIPPANLENALDPSNPNSSDWGWTTINVAGYLGYINITFPSIGLYLVAFAHNIAANNIYGISTKIIWYDPFYNTWASFETGVSSAPGRVEPSPFVLIPVYFLNIGYPHLRLGAYVNNAGTFNYALHSFVAFKIA